jgi:hypothetical protein
VEPILNEIKNILIEIASNSDNVSNAIKSIKRQNQNFIQNTENEDSQKILEFFQNFQKNFTFILVNNDKKNDLEMLEAHLSNYSYLLRRKEKDPRQWEHTSVRQFKFGPEFNNPRSIDDKLSLRPINGTVAILEIPKKNNRQIFLVDTLITPAKHSYLNFKNKTRLWMGGFCFDLKIFRNKEGKLIYYKANGRILNIAKKDDRIRNDEPGLCFVFSRHQTRMKDVDPDNPMFNGIKWTEMLYNIVRNIIHLEITNNPNDNVTLKSITRAVSKYLNSMRTRTTMMERDDVNNWLIQYNLESLVTKQEAWKKLLKAFIQLIPAVLSALGISAKSIKELPVLAKAVKITDNYDKIFDAIKDGHDFFKSNQDSFETFYNYWKQRLSSVHEVVYKDSGDEGYIPELMQDVFENYPFLKIYDLSYRKIYAEVIQNSMNKFHINMMNEIIKLIVKELESYLKFGRISTNLIKSGINVSLSDFHVRLNIIQNYSNFVKKFSEKYYEYIGIFFKYLLEVPDMNGTHKEFISNLIARVDLQKFVSKFADLSGFATTKFIDVIKNHVLESDDDKKNFREIINLANNKRGKILNNWIYNKVHPTLIYFDKDLQFQLVYDIIIETLAAKSEPGREQTVFDLENYSRIIFEEIASAFLSAQFIISTAEMEYTYSERMFHGDGFVMEEIKELGLQKKQIKSPDPNSFFYKKLCNNKGKGLAAAEQIPINFWYNVPFGSWGYKNWLTEKFVDFESESENRDVRQLGLDQSDEITKEEEDLSTGFSQQDYNL